MSRKFGVDVVDVDATCSMKECTDKGTYSLDGVCTNCGQRVLLKITKGHEFPSVEYCPTCRCSTIRRYHGT